IFLLCRASAPCKVGTRGKGGRRLTHRESNRGFSNRVFSIRTADKLFPLNKTSNPNREKTPFLQLGFTPTLSRPSPPPSPISNRHISIRIRPNSSPCNETSKSNRHKSVFFLAPTHRAQIVSRIGQPCEMC